jgi:hypothetical protein
VSLRGARSAGAAFDRPVVERAVDLYTRHTMEQAASKFYARLARNFVDLDVFVETLHPRPDKSVIDALFANDQTPALSRVFLA